MSVARTAARSPWRLSKKLKAQSSSTVYASPSACSHNISFSTSSRRLQENGELPNTPATADGIKTHAVSPTDTASTQPATPTAEVERVVGALQHPHRPQDQIKLDIINLAKRRGIPLPDNLDDPNTPMRPRTPRNVQALFLAPMRREPTHGIPVCNLQIRSYSVRNLEYMADFAMRAAYYLNLPAKGPVPLPRITNRWTVPRSNFVFTKTPENFERVTVRRLIQIQDGHPEVVRRWLQFVRKHSWYGVGYKADVFEFEPLDTTKRMDGNEESVNEAIESVDWSLFGRRKGLSSEEEISTALDQLGFVDASSKEPAKRAGAVPKKSKNV